MIKFYKANERIFKSNGLFTAKPLKAIETKKRSLNGWEIEVELPIKYASQIKQDMLAVVMVKSRQLPQAFRINNIEKYERKLKFVARHVMFDAADYYLLDVRPTNMGAAGALNYINDRTDNPSPFYISSDVANSATAYFINKNLLEAWERIEERWGGNYEADNWNINLKNKIGVDRGETIVYGKNLQDIKVFEDWSSVVTKLYPRGPEGIMLPEKFIEADEFYSTPYTKTIVFESEIETEDDEEIPEEVLIEELRDHALEYLKVNQYPMVSYEVKSDVNQDLEIGDTIHVKHPLVDLKTEVQEYTYNLITKRTETLTFGNYSRDVKKLFNSYKKELSDTKNKLNSFDTILGHQTDLINSLNKEGYVVRNENETLILDKKPKEEAKYVWRFGMGGIGFSTNGYEGPFNMAWTQDGKLNTDFIGANTIMTNHLHSSVGSGLDISANASITMINRLMNVRNIWMNSSGVAGLANYAFKSQPIMMTKSQYMMGKGNGLSMGAGIPIMRTVETDTKAGQGFEFFIPGQAVTKRTLVDSSEVLYLNILGKGKSNGMKLFIREYSNKDTANPSRTTEMVSFKNTTDYNLYQNKIQLLTSTKYIDILIDFKRYGNDFYTISDGMLTQVEYSEYEPSIEEVVLASQTSIQLLENEIKLVATDTQFNIDSLEEDIHNAGVEINAKDGITTYGKKFSVMDSNKTKELLGITTINGEETISIDINGGNLGNMSIDNGKIVITSPIYDRKYTDADLSAIMDIILSKRTPNAYEKNIYDLNKDGIINSVDYTMLRNYLLGNRTLSLPLVQSQVEIGNNEGQIISRVLYGDEKLGNETLIQADSIVTGTVEVKGLSIGGKSVEADSNGFLKLV